MNIRQGNKLTGALAIGSALMVAGFSVQGGELDIDLFGAFGVGEEISGTSVSDLTEHESFPDSPALSSRQGDIAGLTAGLQWPPDFSESDNAGDEYGSLVEGYLQVPEDGEWTFYVRSDDGSRFELNRNGTDPGGAEAVAEVPGDACCDPFVDDGVRSSEPISLETGQQYYFRMLHKEGGGGDWWQVGWTGPGVERPTVIGAPFVQRFVAEGELAITQHPEDVTVDEGGRATLSVGVDAEPPVDFQWLRDGEPVADAVNGFLILPAVSGEDDGVAFSVEVSNAAGSVTSDTATLTVVPDEEPPSVVRVEPRLIDPNLIDVTFSEPVDEGTATDAANYSINNEATVESVELGADPNRVVVTADGIVDSMGGYELTVSGVEDQSAAGNAMAAQTVSLVLFPAGFAEIESWTYSYITDQLVEGESDTFSWLDGSWSHDNGSDEFDGSGIGEGAPGGLNLLDGSLRLQDTGDPRDFDFSDPGSNRKIYFGRDLEDAGAGADVLDTGLTMKFRARIPTDDPLDPLHPGGADDTQPYPRDTGDGYGIGFGGKGHIGIKQEAGGKISFSLTTSATMQDLAGLDVGPGLVMNNGAGTSVGGNVDTEDIADPEELNHLPLDPTEWNDFWITIREDETGTATHQVDIYLNEDPTPETFFVTAGDGEDFAGISYLGLGLPATAWNGALDIQDISFQPEVVEPMAAPSDPLPDARIEIVEQPQDQTVELGLDPVSATFSIEAQAFSADEEVDEMLVDWVKDGEVVGSGETLTTGPLSLEDDGSTIQAVARMRGARALSDEVTLTVLPDTTAPQLARRARGLPGLGRAILSFNKPLEVESAESAANYSVVDADGSPLSVTGATLLEGGQQVRIETAEQSVGTRYEVTVTGVRDRSDPPNEMTEEDANEAIFFGKGDRVVQAPDETVVIEAEHFNENVPGGSGHEWEVRTEVDGFSGSGYAVTIPADGENLVSGPSDDINILDETAARLDYEVEFDEPGTYYAWARTHDWADGSRDSINLGVNLQELGPADMDSEELQRQRDNSFRITGGGSDWAWNNSRQGPEEGAPLIEIDSAGVHTINLVVRETGSVVDKLFFTPDPDFVPQGSGPRETREGAPPAPSVEITQPAELERVPEEPLTIEAEASSEATEVVRVEFFADGEKIGEATSSPYSIEWMDPESGEVILTATATDDVGEVVSSGPVTVFVGVDQIIQHPESQIVAEGESATFTVEAAGAEPFTYQWRLDGEPISGANEGTLTIDPVTLADRGAYSVVVETDEGDELTSEEAQLLVTEAGWAYTLWTDRFVEGEPETFSWLDSTWSHDNGSDEWDGSAIGEGSPGGISPLDGFLRLQEAGDPRDHGFSDPGSNRKLYLAHDLTSQGGTANTLDEGLTLKFRARIPTDDPIDPLHPAGADNTEPYPEEGDGYVIHNGGKGSIGIKQESEGLISFSLTTAAKLNEAAGVEEAGLIMNDLNGASISSDVDTDEEGELNLLPLDPTEWHEFWITVEADESGTGTHEVNVFLDGSTEPETFTVTAGDGSDFSGFSYLALGLGATPESGALDIENISFRPGVSSPGDAPQPTISIGLTAEGAIQLEWSGTLQVSDSVEGPYTDVPDAESPMVVEPEGVQQFWRTRSE